MSGHSKWATIHRQKEITDQKRGQAFTKIANAITVAVRESGGITDQNLNFKLRLALEKARQVNMPKDNVQRAIDRGAGISGEGAIMEEVVYEGYGPGGVAILIEAATDNRQRTVQEVKNILERGGGSLGSPGAVSFLFKKTGLIVVKKEKDIEETVFKIIDLGADEVEEAEDGIKVYVGLDKFDKMKADIAGAGLVILRSEMVAKPISVIPISDPKTASNLLSLLEKLDSRDDVLRVYANFDIPPEVLGAVRGGSAG